MAERNVQVLRPACEADLDEQIVRIGVYLDLMNTAPTQILIGELHRLANCIISFAGLYGYDGMALAATSMCEVLERLEAPGAWRKEFVLVHYDALRVLRHPQQLLPGEQERLLAGLRKVREHV